MKLSDLPVRVVKLADVAEKAPPLSRKEQLKVAAAKFRMLHPDKVREYNKNYRDKLRNNLKQPVARFPNPDTHGARNDNAPEGGGARSA